MLSQHNIRAADVQAIEIGFPPGTDTPLIHTNPQTGLEAKFSIEYSAAATVLDGKVGIDTYTDDPLGDFNLTTAVYAECGKRVSTVVGRGVILQEGGYFLPRLGENVRQFLLGVESAHTDVRRG